MKNLLAAALALALLLLVVETGIAPAHEGSWQFVAAATAATIPTFGGAFTIREFCEAHRISEAFFYVMKAEGWAPDEMHAGARTLISFELLRSGAASARPPLLPVCGGRWRARRRHSTPLPWPCRRRRPGHNADTQLAVKREGRTPHGREVSGRIGNHG